MNDDPTSPETGPVDPADTNAIPPASASASEEPTMAMNESPQSDAAPAPPAAQPTGATRAHLWWHRPRWQWAALLSCIVIGAVLIGVAIGYGVWGGSSRQIAFPGQHRGSSGFDLPYDNGNGNDNGGMPSGNGGGMMPYGNGGGMPYGYGPGGSGQNGSGSSGSGSSGSGSSAAGAPSNVSQIASGVSPGLVDLTVTLAYQNGHGAATGIVLTPSGEVLTNNHVVEGASSISATDIGNGKTYSATVVGYDRSHDIAILQLSGASGLQTTPLGDSSTVAVGEAVVAIGNAGGAGGTPSAAGGSVIAIDQRIVAGGGVGGSEPLTGLIEVNANVQPGDSGGPLVNTDGKAIGVDTAASARFAFRGATGRGYAVPINEALAIAQQIESGVSSGAVHVGPTAFLGVELATSRAQGSNGLGGQSGSAISGAIVAGVLPGAPAAKAGLRSGDVITSLGGQRVDSASALTSLVGQHRPGDSVQVVWVDRSGKSHTATVKLATGPAA
jgi:S1-C subfamily serine protease